MYWLVYYLFVKFSLMYASDKLYYDLMLLKQWSRKLKERWTGPYHVVWEGLNESVFY